MLKQFISKSPEARFYTPGKNGSVTCGLCAKRCTIPPGQTGFCGVRYNNDGKLRSLVYGRVAAIHLAPSELKPFFHFYPGAFWLSLGTIGCNLKCPGCQNWHLAHSQADPALLSTQEMTPEHVTELAQRSLCEGLSFTYNEPTVWLEFTLDAAKAAREKDLLSTYVSNGMMTTEALEALLGCIAAFRLDIKGFSEKTYNALASPGDWEQVKANAKLLAGSPAHLEIVTNVIPGKNDDPGELAELAAWIKSELGAHTPWHITRFHPSHELSHISPTPLDTLENAHDAAQQAGLEFVYIGNVPGHTAESTYCPQCASVVIGRHGIAITEVNLDGSRCASCGREIGIVGAPESTQ